MEKEQGASHVAVDHGAVCNSSSVSGVGENLIQREVTYLDKSWIASKFWAVARQS